MHTVLPVLALAAVLAVLAACRTDDGPGTRLTHVEGGQAERGQRLLARYQCGSCHVIPGVPSSEGRSGPPLTAFGRRSYIAGQVPNGPETLTRWLLDPQALLPHARMPDMGASEADARDMAAYLQSLR
jgi:cytochrome c2